VTDLGGTFLETAQAVVLTQPEQSKAAVRAT